MMFRVQGEKKSRTKIERLLRHTARRISPRKVPVHPVLKKNRQQQKEKGGTVARDKSKLTWAVEPPSCGDVKHGAGDGEQDPPAILSVELYEGARGVGREEQGRRVRAWHPRVARLELCGGRAREGRRGNEDALEEIEDVKQQGGVDRVGEGK